MAKIKEIVQVGSVIFIMAFVLGGPFLFLIVAFGLDSDGSVLDNLITIFWVFVAAVIVYSITGGKIKDVINIFLFWRK
jgi:hypothetical protein